MHETEHDFRMGRFDMSHKQTQNGERNGKSLNGGDLSSNVPVRTTHQKAELHQLNQVLFNIVSEVFV